MNPLELRLRAWRDGEIIHRTPLQFEEKYGTEIYYIHRADFHDVLVNEARKLGVNIRLQSAVRGINFEAPSIQIDEENQIKPDLIVGADGLHSICRENLLGRKDPPRRTGDLAYRLTVKVEEMRQHPILHELIEDIPNDLWMGPDTYVVGYLLKENGFYNMAVICPDTLPEDIDVSKATAEEMRELLEGWDERLQVFLSVVQETQKWRMLTIGEMYSWGHDGGKFVLLGDACHASLPYLWVQPVPQLFI